MRCPAPLRGGGDAGKKRPARGRTCGAPLTPETDPAGPDGEGRARGQARNARGGPDLRDRVLPALVYQA